MKGYLKIVYSIISVLSLVLILTFKTLPSGQVWKKYNILYVPVSVPNDAVINALDSSEIKNYVCLSNQYLPVDLPKNSPELSLLKLKTDDFYLSKRTAFFYDKSQNFRLYYIPCQYKSALQKTVHNLSAQKIKCGVDTHSSYPMLVPIFVIGFAVFLYFFVKNKVVYTIGAVYSIIFSICNPFYPVAAALIVILLFLFFISVLWKREGFLQYFKNNILFLITFGISVLCMFCSSLTTIFIFLFFLGGIYSSLQLYNFIEQKIIERKRFQSVYILSAKRVDIFPKKAYFVLPVAISITGIILFTCILSSFTNVNSSFSSVLLPGKTKDGDTKLPQFEDYYEWNWDVMTAPYKSINSEITQKGSVEFPYYETENGIITKKTKELNFNQNFKNDVYNKIDDLSFNSLEEIMKTEGSNFSCGYVSLNSYTINPIGIFMIIICFSVLLFIYISSIMKKGLKK